MLKAEKDKIEKYINCFKKWSAIHNISSKKNNDENINENIEDSLVGREFLAHTLEVVDVGAGGGFPSIPLAICMPHISFRLVESCRKKCSFLRFIKAELLLENVQVINERIENLARHPFLISKAAFSPKHISVLAQASKEGGRIVLWSTKLNEAKLSITLEKCGFKLEHAHDYILASSKPRSILVYHKS